MVGKGSVRRGMDPTLINAGTTPTLANTVEERLIGRLTPGFLPSVGTLGAIALGCAVVALVLGRRRAAMA